MPKYIFSFIFLVAFLNFSYATIEYPSPTQGKSGLFGYVDENGSFVIKPQFEKAMPFIQGLAQVMVKHQWRLINEKGKFLTKEAYDSIGPFRNGVAVVSKTESPKSKRTLYGLINAKGTEVISLYYDYFTPGPDQTLFIAGRKGEEGSQGKTRISFGVFDFSGKIVIPVNFSAIRDANFRLFAVKNNQDFWQVFNKLGEPLFTGSYTDVKDFDEELATIKQQGKWGILTRSGQLVVKSLYKDIIKTGKNSYELLPFVQWKIWNTNKETLLSLDFDHVKPIHPSFYSYQKNGKTGLLSEKGTPVTDPLFDLLEPFVNNLAIVKNGNDFGVIDTNGKLLMPIQYETIVIDSVHHFIRARQQNKWGIFSISGKALTPLIYEEVRMQPHGLFNVLMGKQWYVLDASGHIFGSSSFDHITDFTNLHAVVCSRGRAGIINSRGTWVVDPSYDSLLILNPQIAVYRIGEQYGMLNLYNRNIILTAEYLAAMDHNNRYFRVIKEGKTGIWNDKGQEIIPAKFDYVSNYSKDSLVSVILDEKKGLVNLQGKTVLRPQALYQELHIMEEERVGVRIKNKYGFVDRNGNLRIANRYEGIGVFSEGMVAIKLRGLWGFIDLEEELRVQPAYEEVLRFKNGTAPVKRNGLWGFVDRKGRESVKPIYDSIQPLPTGRYLVSKDGKVGLVTEMGKELLVAKYELIQDLGNGFIIITRNGKSGIIDTKGFDVLPVMYDYLFYNPGKNLYITGVVPPIQKFVYTR